MSRQTSARRVTAERGPSLSPSGRALVGASYGLAHRPENQRQTSFRDWDVQLQGRARRTRSVLPKGHHRFDADGTPRRNPAGEKADGHDHGCHRQQSREIVRRRVPQLTDKQPVRHDAGGHAEQQPIPTSCRPAGGSSSSRGRGLRRAPSGSLSRGSVARPCRQARRKRRTPPGRHRTPQIEHEQAEARTRVEERWIRSSNAPGSTRATSRSTAWTC